MEQGECGEVVRSPNPEEPCVYAEVFVLDSTGSWGVRGSDSHLMKFCSSMEDGSQEPSLVAGSQVKSYCRWGLIGITTPKAVTVGLQRNIQI